jgi:hypothetical protein
MELNLKSEINTISIKIKINARKKQESMNYRKHRRRDYKNLIILKVIIILIIEEINFINKNKII